MTAFRDFAIRLISSCNTEIPVEFDELSGAAAAVMGKNLTAFRSRKSGQSGFRGADNRFSVRPGRYFHDQLGVVTTFAVDLNDVDFRGIGQAELLGRNVRHEQHEATWSCNSGSSRACCMD